MVDKFVPERISGLSGHALLNRWRARPCAGSGSNRGPSLDRRREKRRRVRLNWGKALNVAERFLCDCLIVNRSAGGARLRLARRIALPKTFLFFDDVAGALYAAEVVWRQGELVGCLLAREPLRDRKEVVKRMANRYYAL